MPTALDTAWGRVFLVPRRRAWRRYDVGGIPGVKPNRITLSAADRNETLAAIPVGLDSRPGLFVDKRYRDEGDSIRARKRKACNFTKLALATGARARPARATLFHIAYSYERRINRCTDLVVEVNPRRVAIVDALRQAN